MRQTPKLGIAIGFARGMPGPEGSDLRELLKAVENGGAGRSKMVALGGFDLAEAARFANAAAAISVTRHGAQASAPLRAEVEARLREAETSPTRGSAAV